MRLLGVLAAFGGVLVLSSASHALQISSPTIFGGFAQDRAECVVLNGGTGSLTVTVKIVSESGGTVKSYNCGGALGPGGFCATSTAIDFGVGYACVATAGAIANLRGALVIQEALPDGFGGTYIRAMRSAPLR